VGRSYAFQEVAENREEDEPAKRTEEQLLHVPKLNPAPQPRWQLVRVRLSGRRKPRAHLGRKRRTRNFPTRPGCSKPGRDLNVRPTRSRRYPVPPARRSRD
jgi:hypothetical protein